jgi:multisubunit Na+/H+ antiporter MnhG subunit
LLIYAIVVTVIAVIATLAIGRAASKAGVKDEESAEVQELKGLRSELRSLRDELMRSRGTEAA